VIVHIIRRQTVNDAAGLDGAKICLEGLRHDAVNVKGRVPLLHIEKFTRLRRNWLFRIENLRLDWMEWNDRNYMLGIENS
jgi:hypothetical protein